MGWRYSNPRTGVPIFPYVVPLFSYAFTVVTQHWHQHQHQHQHQHHTATSQSIITATITKTPIPFAIVRNWLQFAIPAAIVRFTWRWRDSGNEGVMLEFRIIIILQNVLVIWKAQELVYILGTSNAFTSLYKLVSTPTFELS